MVSCRGRGHAGHSHKARVLENSRCGRMRWPNGFLCPKCGVREHAFCEPRQLFQCRACRTQTSARAGTIFHKSHTPLAKWFLAMHLITASKNDIAARSDEGKAAEIPG